MVKDTRHGRHKAGFCVLEQGEFSLFIHETSDTLSAYDGDTLQEGLSLLVKQSNKSTVLVLHGLIS